MDNQITSYVCFYYQFILCGTSLSLYVLILSKIRTCNTFQVRQHLFFILFFIKTIIYILKGGVYFQTTISYYRYERFTTRSTSFDEKIINIMIFFVGKITKHLFNLGSFYFLFLSNIPLNYCIVSKCLLSFFFG